MIVRGENGIVEGVRLLDVDDSIAAGSPSSQPPVIKEQDEKELEAMVCDLGSACLSGTSGYSCRSCSSCCCGCEECDWVSFSAFESTAFGLAFSDCNMDGVGFVLRSCSLENSSDSLTSVSFSSLSNSHSQYR